MLMLDEKAFRGRERHGQSMFGHRLGIGSRVAGQRHLRRQLTKWNVIDAGTQELNQPHFPEQRQLLWSKFLGRVSCQQDIGAFQSVLPFGSIQLAEITNIGDAADRLLNDRAVCVLNLKRNCEYHRLT
jgi:hypothetical protein